MRILTLSIVLGLAACGTDEDPSSQQSSARSTERGESAIRPPGKIAFRAAWVVQCEGVGADVRDASCETDSSDTRRFSCDFALRDGREYRGHSAELRRSGDVWVLADPVNTCDAAGS